MWILPYLWMLGHVVLYSVEVIAVIKRTNVTFFNRDRTARGINSDADPYVCWMDKYAADLSEEPPPSVSVIWNLDKE